MPDERQIDAQTYIQVLTNQRNALFTTNAQLEALLAMADARIAQLETEVKTLRGKDDKGPTLVPHPGGVRSNS